MRSRLVPVVGLALLAGVLCLGPVGCKSDSTFTEDEIKQMKGGGPKEIPAQGRELLGKMGKDGNQGAPPRPVGQPGPGSPFSGGAPGGK